MPSKILIGSAALIGSLSTTVAWATYRFGLGAGVKLLALEVIGACYTFVVLCNPDVATLLGHPPGPSSAARTCNAGQQPDEEKATRRSVRLLKALEGLKAPIDAGDFYEEYHGHKVEHLQRARSLLAQGGCNRFIYLCGDSSLDNKHWFFEPWKEKRTQLNAPKFTAKAINGYQNVLRPSRMVKDVSYHLNILAAERWGDNEVCTLMTSVEESTVEDRTRHGLLAQDVFIRDNITPDDSLIVSVGGNDIALHPTLRTALNMLVLVKSPAWTIRAGIAPGLGYFVRLFRSRIQKFVSKVVAKQKPSKILICMLYYLDEKKGGSWADETLARLGYDDNPRKLQLIIRTIFNAIERTGFDIPGSTSVTPFALFKVLDGKTHGDYKQRVEPSVQGGRKMARAFLSTLFPDGAALAPGGK